MKKYHIVSRVAIYLLALVLIGLGIYHFLYPRDVLVYLPPNLLGNIWLPYVVGAAFTLVGISFFTNQYVKFTGYFLAVMLFLFIVGIHLPNYMNAGDVEMSHLALMNMLKDTAIMGFSLHIAAGAHHQHLHVEEEAD
jgi:putative oxidoreductase